MGCVKARHTTHQDYHQHNKMKKRILITGRAIPHQPDRCTGQQLVQGFREAGHDAHFFGCFYLQPHNFLGSKECQSMNGWDLVIATEMNDGMPGYETLYQYYKLKDVPKIYWDFDISYNETYAWQRAGAHKYDAYLVANKYYTDKFVDKFNKPTLHLPYACSPVIHKRYSDINRQHMLGFIGSMTPERQVLANKIHCMHGIFGDDMVKAINTLHTMVHINQRACKGMVPCRPWETSGCGTNLLMDRDSYDDFKQFITPELDGTAVVPFDHLDEVDDYIKKYKDSTELLEKYAKDLMSHAHNNHSYKNRADSIISWCEEIGLLPKK